MACAVLPRRCISFSDLTHLGLSSLAEGTAESPSSNSSDLSEDAKPIKRSRSDQSLTATAHLVNSSSRVSLAAGTNGNSRETRLLPHGYNFGHFAKVQHVPSLPVVLSDVGSSTNSLVSLESEPNRLSQHISSPRSIASPAATSSLRIRGLTQGDLALLQSYKRVSSGVALYSLHNVSSAASLTNAQYQYTADLKRAASDASLGSGSYLAGLQQLAPPLPPYSPPPLFSSGSAPLPTTALGTSAANDSQPGFTGLKGGSILQQKQAGFAALPADSATDGASTSASVAVLTNWATGLCSRGPTVVSVGSLDSIDSINSVEAGEHIVAFGYRAGRMASVADAAVPARPASTAPAATPPAAGRAPSAEFIELIARSDTANAASLVPLQHQSQPQQQQQQLQQQVGVRPVTSGSSTAKDNQSQAEASAAAAAEAASAVNGGDGDGCVVTGSTDSFVSSAADDSVTALDSQTSQRSQQQIHQLRQQLAGALHTSSVARGSVSSPSVELQVMGSMMGNEGEQWLLSEVSTGAIGGTSPTGFSKQEPQDQQQQQLHSAPAAVDAAVTASMQLTAAGALESTAVPSSAANVAATSSSADAVHNQPCSEQQATPAAHAASNAANASDGKSSSNNANITSNSSSCVVSKALPTSTTSALPAASAPVSSAFGSAASAAAAAKLGFVSQSGAAAAASAAAVAAQAFMQGIQQKPAGTNGFTKAGTDGTAASASGLPPVPASASGIPPKSPGGIPASYWASSSSPSGNGGYQQRHGQGLQQQRQQGSLTGGAAGSYSPTRRYASLDFGARTQCNTRRRGSLELNMPWRTRLDAVIAAQAATDGSSDTPHSPLSGRSSMSAASSSGLADIAGDLATETEDPFGTGAISSGLVTSPPGWQQQHRQQQGSGLDALLGQQQEQQPLQPRQPSGALSFIARITGRRKSTCESIAESAAEGASSNNSSRRNSVSNDVVSKPAITDKVEHTASGQRGTPSASEVDPRSYGLEFDGAVVLQSVEPLPDIDPTAIEAGRTAATDSNAAASSSKKLQQSVLLQQQQCGKLQRPQQQQQRQVQQLAVLEDQQEQQDQTEESDSEDEHGYHLRLGNRSHSGVSNVSVMSGISGSDTETPLATPTAAGPTGQQLVSASSISSSISSISSRVSSAFYSRRGAGSGSSGAAYELFVRLNRARQTLDFAKRQAQAFAELDKAELGVWEALNMLNGLREYEAVLLANASASGGSGRSTATGGAAAGDGVAAVDEPLTPDMPLKEHALQVAELCRLSFPDKPWMALVGLLHGLGKLLAHPLWGSQPQWAVTGESYPLGCRFAPQISHSEFFSANPDRRRRAYSTALGVYSSDCGLRNVYMSWGAPEYMYMMLVLNQTQLPEEALFLIRCQRCTAFTRPGGAYRQLMSDSDRALLPLLAAFQSLTAYRRVQLPPEALQGQALVNHYSNLISAYLGDEKLFW